MKYYHKNLIILSITSFLAAISWNQVIPFLPLFLKELGVGENSLYIWVAVVYAMQSCASIIAQPLWGKLGDATGRKPMIIRAGMFLTIIYFGMSFSQSALHLAIFRFLNGALTGFIPGTFALIATNTPEDEAPAAVATAQASTAGGMIFGPAFGGILASIFGYRGSMRVSGTFAFIATILVLLFVKEVNKSKPSEKTTIIQDFAFGFKSKVLLSVLIAVLVHSMCVSAITPMLVLHLKSLNLDMPKWFPIFLYLMPGFIMWGIVYKIGSSSGWIKNTKGKIAAIVFIIAAIAALSPIIKKLLVPSIDNMPSVMPDWFSGLVFSLPSLAFLITARSWTSIGKNIKYENGIKIGLILSALFAIVISFVQNAWFFAVMFFVLGIWFASTSPLASAITCQRIDEHFRGRAYAITQSATMLGALVAPLGAGVVAKVYGIDAVFLSGGIVLILGTLLFSNAVKKWEK
ncbi:MAG: MFS transporter [Armatimonadota bacterium]